jgi:hypothetical protein
MDAAVIIPTRRRPAYLDVALAGVMPQARARGIRCSSSTTGPTRDPAVAEGPRRAVRRGPRPAAGSTARATRALRRRARPGVAAVPRRRRRRGAGVAGAMLLGAAEASGDVGFLTGPVRARFEDHPLRGCGRERPPVTSLDLGPDDADSPVAWGVNMGVRRALLDRVGPWDETLVNGGDEEELQARSGARIRYLARAAVDHRRAGDDARLGALCRAQRARGRAARRFDAARGRAPALRAELRVLAGCLGHLVRYRCPQGLVMAAHTLGRIEEAWDPTPRPAEDFLSGASGTVGGWRGRAAAGQDRLLDLRAALEVRGPRRPAAGPRRRVLVLAVERPGSAFPAARAELERSRHDVTVATTGLGGRGKFQNLNALLAAHDLAAFDWVLVVDDDVVLPRRFLDAFRLPRDGPAARPARPSPPLPRGVAAHPPASRGARARHDVRGDRARDRHPPDGLRRAAPVPGPADGLGPGRPLGRGGRRPGVEDGDRGRHPDPARDARGRGLRPGGGGRRGARVPRRAPVPHAGRRAVRVCVVAEYYPRAHDPVLGIWAHRQALAARDAGAEVHVVVLHRPIPPLSTPRAELPGAALRLLRHPRRRVLDGLEVDYVPFAAPPRPGHYGTWGAWAAPSLAVHLRRLRRRFRFDLVHAHYAIPGGDAVRRAWPRAPLVVSAHGGDGLYDGLRTPNVARAFSAARLVLCNSQGTAERAGGPAPRAPGSSTWAPTFLRSCRASARSRRS